MLKSSIIIFNRKPQTIVFNNIIGKLDAQSKGHNITNNRFISLYMIILVLWRGGGSAGGS